MRFYIGKSDVAVSQHLIISFLIPDFHHHIIKVKSGIVLNGELQVLNTSLDLRVITFNSYLFVQVDDLYGWLGGRAGSIRGTAFLYFCGLNGYFNC